MQTEQDRISQAQNSFKHDFVVSTGSNYYVVGPPSQCSGDRKNIPSKNVKGAKNFTNFVKNHNELERIRQSLAQNPVISRHSSSKKHQKELMSSTERCGGMGSDISTSAIKNRLLLQERERSFRPHISKKQSWKQFPPLDISKDPYFTDKSELIVR